jgi:plastocyanin
MLATVNIDDTNPLDMKFVPQNATVGPGGKVHWNNVTTTSTLLQKMAGECRHSV